jgi:hypothetical protein
MSEVEPNFKPLIGPCACGCGTEARPQTRKRKDGLQHARGCPCARCKGARTRKGGGDGQRDSAKRAEEDDQRPVAANVAWDGSNPH